jgi:hypothetical protein
VAGCGDRHGVTGTVAHERVSVGVRRTTSAPVDTTLAVVTYERDGQVVTGEYADVVPSIFVDGSITVSELMADELRDQFSHVHYHADIVPDGGATPVSG